MKREACYPEATEFQVCCAITEFAAHHDLPMFHIPNGGERSKFTGSQLKRIGMLAGVSDYFFIKGNQSYKGLFLEAKTIKGRLADNQKWFLEVVNRFGYLGIVVYGIDDALKQISEFYGL